MPLSNKAHAIHLWSLCFRAQELQLLSSYVIGSMFYNKRSHCNENPSHCKKRKPGQSNEDPMQPK